MNAVSWYLYLGHVAGGLSVFFVLILIGSMFVGTGSVLLALLVSSTEGAEETRPVWKAAKVALIISAIAGPLAIAVPDSKTLYMIAASEMGEQVITSPDGKEITDALKAKVLDLLKTD